jgi:UDP-N-acetylmuramyl pentapeptide synthase
LKDVILIGAEFSKVNSAGFMTFQNTSECLNYLKGQKIKNKTILIKGSRGMKLEVLKDEL